ncbi:hypothetical protein PMIN06_001716 [Paraphaeosphaeria minitans]
MLFNDIQRTEPFARLARPHGSVPPASRTILEGPRQVWTAFAHAFNKKHNGGKRSWIIIWASVVLVLSSIIISLSSALLASEETNMWQPLQAKRLIPEKASALEPSVKRDTYFRTTGAILQNVTTSPWISDEYAILPFWPEGSIADPWDAQYNSTPQTWEANTTVFRNDLQCSPLRLAATDVWSYDYDYYNMTNHEYRMSIRLENDAGCKYNMSFNASDKYDFNSWEGGSWSDLNTFVFENDYAVTSSDIDNRPLPWKPTYNDKCHGDEIMVMSSQWIRTDWEPLSNVTAKFPSNLTVSGYLCESSHTMANIKVRVSTSASDFHVEFDIGAFQGAQKEVPPSVLDTSKFTKAYTDPYWYEVIPKLNFGSATPSGAMALLATQYDFDFYKMKNDTKLPELAARVQRRHSGEILRTSLNALGVSQTEAITGSLMASERRITVRMEAAAALVALFASCFFTMLGVIWLSTVRRRPLHLTHEPATVLGIVSLVSSNPSVLASLRDLDQASTAELRSVLKGRFFSTSHGHLREVCEDGQLETPDPAPRIPTLAEKESPLWVKIRALLGLIIFIGLLIMAITVVHRFASDSDLKKGFFTYHLNINALGHLGSFTPFSIIPTTLAVLLGLWWNALDVTFRSLQPYVAMSQAPREISRGAYISYQSTYWLWATGKAAKNKHWLLSLVTLGTFLAQAFTIATSALFEQTTGVINDAVKLNRSLELRQIPYLRMVNETYPPTYGGSRGAYGYPYVGTVLEDLFGNLTNNWLYSGVIQATMNGSEPKWSKDGWSFVPVDLSDLKNRQTATSDTDSDQSDAYGAPINITMTTPAIRGRVECYQPEEIRNGSTNWNYNTTWTDPDTNQTKKVNMPATSMFGGPTLPDSRYVSCCYNHTDSSLNGSAPLPLALGYWTQDFANTSEYVSASLNNFTVKWVAGDGASLDGLMSDQETLYFPNIPNIQAVKCMPVFEKAEADIVVDKQGGSVLSYHILGEPTPDDGAWTDAFVLHALSDPNDPAVKKEIKDTSNLCDPDFPCLPMVMQNITTSYGNLFMNSLLRASRLQSLANSGANHGPPLGGDTADMVFNIQDNVTGLNLDFMSYAAYVQADRDPKALLDLNYMLESTQRIFTLFFQHYVSSTYSLKTGGWAYQPIGANQDGLGAANETFPQFNPDGTRAKEVSELPAEHTNRTASATMSTRVEVLHMNPKAVWLCVALLIWLALTAILVCALQRWFFGDLRRNVESIADVLVLVAGSERLLAAVEKLGVEGLLKSDVQTRLGWFRTDDGRMRWGIEIAEEGEILMK